MDSTKVASTIDRALVKLRDTTGVALAFGGCVSPQGTVHLEQFAGPTFGAIPGVVLGSGQGLGGRVTIQQRVIATDDYVSESTITHTYDRVIRTERLRAMAAAPIVVGRRSIAVIYGALRTPEAAGEVLQDALARSARDIEQEIVRSMAQPVQPSLPFTDPVVVEQLRSTHRRLRMIADKVQDEALRSQLLEITDDLAGGGSQPAGGGSVSFTRREADALALISGGMSNAQIAAILGLSIYTVKDHVKVIMQKLSARTRHEAVVTARRLGLLP